MLEFFFELARERCEQLCLVLEWFVAMCKMNEYGRLIKGEKVSFYLSKEQYDEMKERQEEEESEDEEVTFAGL